MLRERPLYLCIALQVESGEHLRLAEQLAKVRPVTIKTAHVSPPTNCHPAHHPRLLRGSLQLLAALPFEAHTLHLQGWEASEKVMSEGVVKLCKARTRSQPLTIKLSGLRESVVAFVSARVQETGACSHVIGV